MDNLTKGYYYQATLAESSIHFTAFITLAGMYDSYVSLWGLREHLIISRDLWQP